MEVAQKRNYETRNANFEPATLVDLMVTHPAGVFDGNATRYPCPLELSPFEMYFLYKY